MRAMPTEDQHHRRHPHLSMSIGHQRLDDYIIMEKQRQQADPSDTGTADAVSLGGGNLQELYAQLVQKERDLLLAAQLGKALLEKNEELGLQNEKMAEDYSHQLEVSTAKQTGLRFFFFFSRTFHRAVDVMQQKTWKCVIYMSRVSLAFNIADEEEEEEKKKVTFTQQKKKISALVPERKLTCLTKLSLRPPSSH